MINVSIQQVSVEHLFILVSFVQKREFEKTICVSLLKLLLKSRSYLGDWLEELILVFFSFRTASTYSPAVLFFPRLATLSLAFSFPYCPYVYFKTLLGLGI